MWEAASVNNLKMKKDIIIGVLFLTAVLIKNVWLNSYSLILPVLTIGIIFYLIYDIKNKVLLNHKLGLLIFSSYYQVLFYTAILFRLSHYPGEDFIILFSTIVLIVYTIYTLWQGDRKQQALQAFIYLQAQAVIYILSMP